MELELIFRKIDFVTRYKEICANHSDFNNSMKNSDKNMYMAKLKSFDDSVIYISKDKMFKVPFQIKDFSFDLGLSLKEGVVEARIFYIKNGEWLIYNRFDFLSEELDSQFDRDKYNIPAYSSEAELEVILKEIFSIYADLKQEILKSENNLS